MMEKQNEIGELDRLTIIELADEVIRALASKYANVMQGVDNIMRGPIIETKAKKELLAKMFAGEITVSNAIDAEPAVTAVTVDYQGNSK